MNQYACWPTTFRMKYLQFTYHWWCWKSCPSTCRLSSHRRKWFWFTLFMLFCDNTYKFCTNIFFWFSFRSAITVVNIILQTTPKERFKRIKIRWTCWPNTTAHNFVSEDIEHNLHRHTVPAVWAVAESCWNQSYSLSSSFNSGKNCPRMNYIYCHDLEWFSTGFWIQT
jgi:hypothetical protein